MAQAKSSQFTANHATIGKSLEIGVIVDNDGNVTKRNTKNVFFKLPVLTTTQRNALTAEQGMQVFDSTLGEEYTYRAAGWGTSSGTAAGSLDAALA